MFLLAQELAAEPGRLLGLTVDEWTRLLPVLGTAVVFVIVAAYKAIAKHNEAKREKAKTRVLSDTIEEHADEYPAQASRLKGRALHKANKAGIQDGPDGMEAEAAAAKERLKTGSDAKSSRANGRGSVLALLLCFGLSLLASSAIGCAVGPAAEALIETECRAHDRDLEEWDSLTPEQRETAHEDSRAGVYGIRHAVSGVPLPPDLQARHEADMAAEGNR